MPETQAAIQQAQKEVGRLWKFLFWILAIVFAAISFLYQRSINSYEAQVIQEQTEKRNAVLELKQCNIDKYNEIKAITDRLNRQVDDFTYDMKMSFDSVTHNQRRVLGNQEIIKKKLSK